MGFHDPGCAGHKAETENHGECDFGAEVYLELVDYGDGKEGEKEVCRNVDDTVEETDAGKCVWAEAFGGRFGGEGEVPGGANWDAGED